MSTPGRAQKVYTIEGVDYDIHQVRARLPHVPWQRIERRLKRGWRTWAKLGAERMPNGGGSPWSQFNADRPYFASKATVRRLAEERAP